MPDWQEILGEHGHAVWRTAYRLLCNVADADECYQEAFLDALKLSRREEVKHWRALLLRLVTSRALDRIRRNRRRDPQGRIPDWDAIRDRGPSPLQSAENAELAQRLRIALGRIPPKQAEVFCLHSLEGWSYEEIARHIGMTTDAVGILLFRARNRLRRLLEQSAPAGTSPAVERREPSGSATKEPS